AVARGPRIHPEDLSWRFSRSSGPGGQGVNTTDSRVELIFDVRRARSLTEQQRARLVSELGDQLHDGRLVIVASTSRSQLRNRQLATERLTALLADALTAPPPPRRPTKPS